MRDAVAQGARVLARAGVPTPEREARHLFLLAGGEVEADPWAEVPCGVGRRYRALVEARARRVPRPLLEGETGFLDFEVRVCPGVFVPRPETEELAERAVALLRALPPSPRALDLGTGTGALAIALARARPDAWVLAVDASPRAVACARRNVGRLGLAGRVEVRRSDWFSEVSGRFDLLVSNPPYVARGELGALEPEVRRYEPRRALDGGEDGLDAVRTILAGAPEHVVPGGMVLLEIGHGQGEAVLRLARGALWAEARIEPDLSGRERFFIGRCG